MPVRNCKRCGNDFDPGFEIDNPREVCDDCRGPRNPWNGRGKFRRRVDDGSEALAFTDNWKPGARLRVEGEC